MKRPVQPVVLGAHVAAVSDLRHQAYDVDLSIRADSLILFPLIEILAAAAMLHCSAIRQWLRQNPLKPVS